MRIGLDLDNTIAIYDNVFAKLGKTITKLPKDCKLTKKSIADFLRKNGREEEWTKIQGLVYGPKMEDAVPAPFFLDAVKRFHKSGFKCFVVSHRTKIPASGDNFNLHNFANQWIDNHCRQFLTDVFFEETINKKIRRIQALELNIFIDDLEKILKKLKQSNIKKVLYTDDTSSKNQFIVMNDWKQIMDYVFYMNPLQ